MFKRLREELRAIFSAATHPLYNKLYVEASDKIRTELEAAATNGDCQVYQNFMNDYGGTVMEPFRLSALYVTAVRTGNTAALGNILAWDRERSASRYHDTLEAIVRHALHNKDNPTVLEYLLDRHEVPRSQIVGYM